MRFARRRFGHYEVIDFLAVLVGYAISGERTLEAFYEQLLPWASAFMALFLFGRERQPARSTLSRFLASLNQAAVEALRTLFLHDLLARRLVEEEQPGGLWDRGGTHWLVFEVDGTRLATDTGSADRPEALASPVCSFLGIPNASGAKSSARVPPCCKPIPESRLATFGNAGNGQYREELRRAVAAIQTYLLKAYDFPEERTLLRLDGQYGTGAVLADLAGLSFVMRGKEYQLLDRAEVQAHLHLPPDPAAQPSRKRDRAHALRLS